MPRPSAPSASVASELATLLAAGDVLLGPVGVRIASQALSAAAEMQRRNGLRMPAQASALQAALQAASERAAGVHASMGASAEPLERLRSSSWTRTEPITTRRAAEMLNVSERRVRQRCARGDFATASRATGPWLIDRAEVLSAYQDADR